MSFVFQRHAVVSMAGMMVTIVGGCDQSPNTFHKLAIISAMSVYTGEEIIQGWGVDYKSWIYNRALGVIPQNVKLIA